VVTVDLSGGEHRWTSDALDVASVALLLWPAGADTAPAYDAGIRWRLHIAVTSAAELDWSLEPLRS
jgi:hypothetical protein